MKDINTVYSKQQMKLQIELIINKRLYQNKKIMKDTYLAVEQNILKDIEKEKMRFEN